MEKDTCTRLHCSTIDNSQDTEATKLYIWLMTGSKVSPSADHSIQTKTLTSPLARSGDQHYPWGLPGMMTGRCGPNDMVWNIHSPQGSHHPPGHLKPSLGNLRLPPLTWSLTSLRCPRKCHVKTPNSPSPQNRTGTFCDSISYGRSPHPHSASQPLILLWTRSLLLN